MEGMIFKYRKLPLISPPSPAYTELPRYQEITSNC